MNDLLRPEDLARVHPRPDLATFAVELSKGIMGRYSPQDHLELVAYLVTFAVARLASRTPWPALRTLINGALGQAVASGLDVGLGLPGHGCIVDSRPPYERTS